MQNRKGRSHQQQARSRRLQQATSSKPTAAATSQATAASSGPSAGPQQSSRPAAAATAAAAGQAAGQATGQQQASGVQASSSSRSAGAHPQVAGRVLQQYCSSYVCIAQTAVSCRAKSRQHDRKFMLAPNSKSNSNRPTESSRCLYEPRRDPGKDAIESRNERPYPEPESGCQCQGRQGNQMCT